MKYVALDFETANASRASACSLGIVVSDGTEITDSWYRLIRPPVMKFDPNCVRVNGIKAEMVENEPEFPAFFREIAALLEKNIIFAHNAGFDMAVLSAMLDWYGLPPISFRYGCTVELSRTLWPDMANHRLNTVANALGFTFPHHHALADAEACEFIVRSALSETKAENPAALMKTARLPLKRFAVKRTRAWTEIE